MGVSDGECVELLSVGKYVRTCRCCETKSTARYGARVDTLKYRMMCLHGIWNVDKMNGHRRTEECHGIMVGSFAIAQTQPNRIHKFHIYLNHLVSSAKWPCTWWWSGCKHFDHVQRPQSEWVCGGGEGGGNLLRNDQGLWFSILDFAHDAFANDSGQCVDEFMSLLVV